MYVWIAGKRASWSPTNFAWKIRSIRGNGWATSAMHFTFWDPSEPDNGGGAGNEDCVNIWPNRNYYWNDGNCDERYCFICENRNIEL